MDPFNSPIQGYDGWNVNASYLTPAYMANYRPKYGDGSSRPNAYSENATIGQSLYRMGPGDHAFGRDVLQDSEHDRYNISTGFGDAAVSGLQNVAIPAAAWYGVTKFNKLGTRFGRKAYMSARVGGFMGSTATRAATGILGRGMGMLGMGHIASAGAGTASAMAGGAGALGSLAGNMFLPFAAAMAVGSTVNTGLIDPYVHTRRGMDSMLANTANMSVYGKGGSANGGFGMSATRAQNISQALTVAGQGDFMLGGGDYNEIADNMMRAGIFQEVGDMDTTRIVDGVKKATSVLKLIQRITGDPDIKNGIQTLATLKAGGLDDINQMGLAVNQLRNASAASGVSMQQLMSTIGNQGAVMAQQQGISANTGMLASADAFAGFTNARRAGLISGTESAMLGGVEGMTQNLMGGAYQTLNSGISRMIMQGGGQFGGTMSDNIQAWGDKVAGDPLASQGDWFLNKQKYMDDAMKGVGASNIILESLQGHARSMGLKHKDARILASLAPSFGISSEQLRSAGLADRAAQDPMSYMRMTDSLRASSVSNRITELQNNNQGLRGIWGLGTAQQMYNEGTRSFMTAGARLMDPFTSVPASISDRWSAGISALKGIESEADQSFFTDSGKSIRYVANETVTTRSGARGETSTSKTRKTRKHNELLSKLNTAEDHEDPEIRKKAALIRSSLASGNIEGATSAFNLLDNELNGYLTGTKTNDFERREKQRSVGKLFSSGEISTEVDTSLNVGPVEKTIKGEMAALYGMKAEDKAEAIKKLMKDKPDAFKAEMGVSDARLKGKTEDEKNMILLDAASRYNVKYDEIDTGDIGTDKSLFYKRFEEQGFTRKQIQSMIHKSSRSVEDFIKDQRETIFEDGDVSSQADIIRKKIEESIDVDTRAERTKSTGIDWSSMKDVTSGLSGLGLATDRNTNATNMLAEVNLALLNSNRGFLSSEKTIKDFTPSPTELVVKPVVKDPKYVGSYGGRS